MKTLTYREAVREALREEMERDETVFLMGEDIGRYGGSGKITQGLIDEFGCERVMDTPLCETGIVGAALGASMVGMRPVVEIMYIDFTPVCGDQIINQVAKAHYMSAGQFKAPLVIRAPQNGLASAAMHHSQSIEAIYAHIPGLVVILPSTPYDAKGLMKTSIRSDDPVLFVECRPQYNLKGEIPEEEYLIPIGSADVKRKGEDVTIVATGRTVELSLKAAEVLAQEGIDVEVVDPRTLKPLDKDTIVESVKKTGHLIISHDACKTGGIGAEIAAVVAEEAVDYLDGPIMRVCAADTPVPFSMKLEKEMLPDEKKITDAVRSLLNRE